MMPPADIVALADRFHRFGALHQAERLYRSAAESRPDDADLWGRLGLVCHAMGRHGEAEASLRRSLALRPGDPVLRNGLGVALMGQGRLEEAVECFYASIQLRDDDPEPHANLAAARMSRGDPDGAVSGYRRALELRPDDAVVSFELGDALMVLGRIQHAAASYRRAVELRPDFAAGWLNLARSLSELDQLDEAVACYEQAAELRPRDPESLAELGTLLLRCGEPDRAVVRLEQFLRLRPDCAEAYSNHGMALMAMGRLDDARLSFEQALYLNPERAELHNNLGLAFLNQGRPEEARDLFERALRLRPELADAHNNLGLALAALGRSDEAFDCYDRAARIDPHHRGALTNLGNACKDRGRPAEAVASYREALATRPEDAPVHSNLLLAMQYQPGLDPRVLLAEARRYARRHADALTQGSRPHTIGAPAGRPLRVGYVSADIREHPVACFLEPILASHDHRHFEVFCYADVSRPDEVTERFRRYVDHWRPLIGLSDAQAAEVIRRDEVDILVDLAGHTGGNRLLAFARRPAPIQASYLGFLGTIGISAMDYYLTDAHADPPGRSEAHYTERLVRLPGCAFCYAPGPAPPIVEEPPVRQSGRITLGCLNNPAKVSEEVLAVWSQVLEAVPGSRLLLRSGAGRTAEERAREVLAHHGVVPERLIFAGWTASRFDYLALHHGIDIALDPFPYNGVTTTCDALWMGVPVISLAGRASVSRQGVRFLRTVGLDELIAETPQDYVRIAAGLAGDPTRLAALRSGLRERLIRSPLLDAHRLTRDLEAAYQAMREQALLSSGPVNEQGRSG